MVQRQAWEQGEPNLEELLSDPIFDCLLRYDGLSRQDVWRAVEVARRALAPACGTLASNHGRSSAAA